MSGFDPLDPSVIVNTCWYSVYIHCSIDQHTTRQSCSILQRLVNRDVAFVLNHSIQILLHFQNHTFAAFPVNHYIYCRIKSVVNGKFLFKYQHDLPDCADKSYIDSVYNLAHGGLNELCYK